MTKTVVYSVKVHTCLIKDDEKVRKYLIPGELYLALEDGYKGYRAIPTKCDCKKHVTTQQAETLVSTGQAQVIWKTKRRLIEPDLNCIWMSQSRQVPRVDLISTADIERAFLDHNEDSIAYIEMVHELYMENRAALIVPFRPDPWEGRTLFTFAREERTKGSYS